MGEGDTTDSRISRAYITISRIGEAIERRLGLQRARILVAGSMRTRNLLRREEGRQEERKEMFRLCGEDGSMRTGKNAQSWKRQAQPREEWKAELLEEWGKNQWTERSQHDPGRANGKWSEEDPYIREQETLEEAPSSTVIGDAELRGKEGPKGRAVYRETASTGSNGVADIEDSCNSILGRRDNFGGTLRNRFEKEGVLIESRAGRSSFRHCPELAFSERTSNSSIKFGREQEYGRVSEGLTKNPKYRVTEAKLSRLGADHYHPTGDMYRQYETFDEEDDDVMDERAPRAGLPLRSGPPPAGWVASFSPEYTQNVERRTMSAEEEERWHRQEIRRGEMLRERSRMTTEEYEQEAARIAGQIRRFSSGREWDEETWQEMSNDRRRAREAKAAESRLFGQEWRHEPRMGDETQKRGLKITVDRSRGGQVERRVFDTESPVRTQRRGRSDRSRSPVTRSNSRDHSRTSRPRVGERAPSPPPPRRIAALHPHR